MALPKTTDRRAVIFDDVHGLTYLIGGRCCWETTRGSVGRREQKDVRRSGCVVHIIMVLPYTVTQDSIIDLTRTGARTYRPLHTSLFFSPVLAITTAVIVAITRTFVDSKLPMVACLHHLSLLVTFCSLCKAFLPPNPPVHAGTSQTTLSVSILEVSESVSRIDSAAVEASPVDDDSQAISCFGTKDYWDDVYSGFGDFPAAEYSWYYDWDEIKRYADPFLRSKEVSILLPGIGNDPLLIDLVAAGYKNLSAQDYCASAIERQRDLLDYVGGKDGVTIDLSVSDVKRLPRQMEESFDVILEKGLLDAVYLSGTGNVEQAVASLRKTLKPGGMFISVSGVVPSALRRKMFAEWKWMRDGENDLKAGCFILEKPGAPGH